MATLKIKQIVVEVTAEDREAAARYMKIIRDGRWSIEGILSGGCDNTSIVQAFARHRNRRPPQGVCPCRCRRLRSIAPPSHEEFVI
jgi:hypothetical protein